MNKDIQKLNEKITAVHLPDDLTDKLNQIIARLEKISESVNFLAEYDHASRYIDWIVSLPWDKKTDDILDLGHARQILDQHHYGLGDLKDRILEYLSVMMLNQRKPEANFRAPILLLVGLVGTGKTTIAKSIAEALGRKFVRIPFGGMGSALDLRGQSRVHPDAEPGQIIKALRNSASNNCVILLDEIDRVAESTRSDIMGVLVELLDPGQNMNFTDHFLDYPFDLSTVMFIATCNNTTNISTAVMDRLEPIVMPSYTDEEKTTIARDYVLPKELKVSGLPIGAIKFDEAVWPKLVRPLGFDGGIRTLERTIQGVVRKIARMYVEGKAKSFYITLDNLKQFLPTY
ncbi:MAG: AAA family ATPase [Candidatus Amesbacteria bacterium]|nr:AAA family ATPase [Candidatus Amesbacteria bacterium]